MLYTYMSINNYTHTTYKDTMTTMQSTDSLGFSPETISGYDQVPSGTVKIFETSKSSKLVAPDFETQILCDI